MLGYDTVVQNVPTWFDVGSAIQLWQLTGTPTPWFQVISRQVIHEQWHDSSGHTA